MPVVRAGGQPIRILMDTREVTRFVKRFTDVTMPREMRRHFNRVGARAANAYRGQVPKGATGNLRKSVRYKVYAKRTGDIGVAVAPMGRLGSHRHLLEFGHMAGGRRVGARPYAAAATAEAAARLTVGIPEAVQAAINSADKG